MLSKTSAMLSKTHSYRLLFRRCTLESMMHELVGIWTRLVKFMICACETPISTTLRAEAFACLKKTRIFWQKLSRFAEFWNIFRGKYSRELKIRFVSAWKNFRERPKTKGNWVLLLFVKLVRRTLFAFYGGFFNFLLLLFLAIIIFWFDVLIARERRPFSHRRPGNEVGFFYK